MMAQTDTTTLTQWAAYFPTDVLLAGVLGSFLAALWWFKGRLEDSANPTTPASQSGVWLQIVTTVGIGIVLSVIAGGAIIDYLKITTPSYRLVVGGGLGLFGVPLIEIVTRLGPAAIIKLTTGKSIPEPEDKTQAKP